MFSIRIGGHTPQPPLYMYINPLPKLLTKLEILYYEEIHAWLLIRDLAKKEKQFKIADMIREQLENQYHINIVDTEGSYTFNWQTT